jgi:hypothetical protein
LNQSIKSIKLDDQIFTGSVFKPTSESQITIDMLGIITVQFCDYDCDCDYTKIDIDLDALDI